MRARHDRLRPTSLQLTRLEDRSVPAGLDVTPLPPPPPYTPDAETGLNFQPPSYFLGGSEYLTGPQAGDPLVLARLALAAYAPALGLSSADAANPVLTNGYADTGSGTFHAYFKQSLNGLEVFNTSVGVHVAADGRVLTVNGGFVPGAAALAGATPTPVVTATGAVAAAASYFGITLTSDPVLTSATGAADQRSVVSEPEASNRPITTRLVYVNTPQGVRPAWEFNLDVPGGRNWYNVAVDAATGQVTFWSDWVENYSATYTALPTTTTDPVAGPRKTLVNPFDPTASPFGWHDINGFDGAEFTDTRGNNVFAQADLFNTNFSSIRPDVGTGLVFNFPLNLASDPLGSVDAAVTNLFYQNNVLHDVHFKYGFDEAAGNFQFTNYSGQGLGGDAVDADALDDAGNAPNFINRNNANFATPPDGFNPRMQMYVFDGTAPTRDGDFATQIVIHEYGHGVSNRLTGGPANANALNNTQSGGMGEGWSDYWALMFTQSAANTKTGANPQGNWALGQTGTGNGARRFPYSFDLGIAPLTFEAYGNTGSVTYTTAGGPVTVPRTTAVHASGEIWASALWDLNWLLIDKYGFDKDLSTGFTFDPITRAPVNGPAGAGNKLSLQLVMDGLKLQPANPTFVEARDAILAADLQLTGGQNRREIWTAFARRGLGFGAVTSNSNDTAVATSFALPSTLSRPAVIGQTPSAKIISAAAPASVTLTFSEAMSGTSFDPAADVLTFTGPNGADLKPQITGSQWVTPTQLRIDFTPPAGTAAQGAYQLVLAPTVLSADNGTQLDQDIDGVAGEAVQDRYVANFQYDALALRAVLSAAPSAADPSLPGAIIVVFNEKVDPDSVSPADLQVSQGTVVNAVVLSDTTVRYDLAGVTSVPFYVTLPYGSVSDPFGFPVEEANASFGRAFIPATPFPTPLQSYGPLGWQSFSGEVASTIANFGETDSYSIELDAGQSLSVIADQLGSLRAQLRLIDPNGNPIALSTSLNSGDPVTVGPVVSPAPGRYVLQISGTSNSTGSYRLRALLQTAVEGESRDPVATNDFTFEAENLDGVVQTQGGPGSTLRAATVAGNIGKSSGGGFGFGDTADFYTFTAAAGEQVTVGLFRPAGGATLTLTVTGPQGTGTVLNQTNFDRAFTFTPTVAGTYTIQVSTNFTSTLGTDYALGLTLNGLMDREANDTVATAQAVALNGNVRGGLTGTDVDWYQITVPAGPNVTLYLTSLTPGDGPNQPDNDLDPDIQLYASNGTDLLVGNADTDNGAGDGRNSLVFRDLAPGNYRFLVRPSPLTPSATTGEYVVQVSTAANPGPLNPSTGGPYGTPAAPFVEGTSLQLSGTATDPNGNPLTYSWDLNGDGVFGDVTGQNRLVTWAELLALGINDGPATFTIQVRVDDGTNPPVFSVPSTLELGNGNPTAAMYIGTTGTDTSLSVDEGSAGVVVRLTSPTDPLLAPTDPSPLDELIGLRYSFDFNNDGTFDAGDGTFAGSLSSPTITVPGSFFADNGTVTVRARVVDKDKDATSGFSDFFVTFTVNNVAPSATGVTGLIGEGVGGPLTVQNPTDPSVVDQFGPNPLRYAFEIDVDGDGTFETRLGGTDYATALTGATVNVTLADLALPLPDGPATIKVRATVYDKDGGFSTTATADLPVLNSAPTGTVSATAQVAEGSTAVVQLTGVADPSAGDTAFGFRYAYDFDSDGTFEIGGATYATSVPGTSPTTSSATVPASFLDDGNQTATTTRTVTVRVYDQDDGFTAYTAVIAIQNQAPTAALTGAPTTLGSPLVVSLTGQADASTADTTAGFVYSFSFNDDDFDDTEDVVNSPSATAQFVFATPNDAPGKTVWARITDKDGGSTTYQQFFVVANVQPTATLAFPTTVTEGGTAAITVTAGHPSPATVAAGFRYAYDFDGDGTFDLPAGATDYTSASLFATVNVPSNFTADGLRPLAVRVRVFEKNGLSTDVVAPIQVVNAPPTATFAGPTGPVEVGDPVTFTFSGTTDPSAADVAAGFRYGVDLNNDGDFDDDGEVSNSTLPTLTASFRTTGNKTVRGRVTDKDGGFTDYFVTASARVPVKTGFAAGVEAGNAPVVQLYDGAGNPSLKVPVFDPGMTGGVRVASADVNGDGVTDVVAGTGPGFPAEVRVIDGVTGRLLFSSRPFEGFTGGVFVAAGDMDGDGRAEFAVSPDMGGGPRVVVYRGNNFLQAISFLGIDDANFRGGARVGLADMTGDGRADLLVSAGFMGGPRVAGFEGSGLLVGQTRKMFNDFFAFEPGLRNGVYLAGGDVTGDGIGDLVVGAGPDGGPRVTIFDGAALQANRQTPVATFFAGNDTRRGGVRVATGDIDGDGVADVMTGEADGPRVNLFFGKNLRTGLPGDDVEIMPFSSPMNGIYVG